MDFQTQDLLEAIGPNATLIFAAWIFLSVLQSRYNAAYERYRSLIDTFRNGNARDTRRESLISQIVLYKRRCEQMRYATNVGIASAVLIIGGLILAALAVVFGDNAFFKAGTSTAMVAGLAAVIWAAAIMWHENVEIDQAIRQEPSDVADLVEAIRRRNDAPSHFGM
jgi:hypothetical protein